MKALMNMLADVRTSPYDVADELMREQPDIQEMFILMFIAYVASMANRSIYHEEVEHIVVWSKSVIKALDKIAGKM